MRWQSLSVRLIFGFSASSEGGKCCFLWHVVHGTTHHRHNSWDPWGSTSFNNTPGALVQKPFFNSARWEGANPTGWVGPSPGTVYFYSKALSFKKHYVLVVVWWSTKWRFWSIPCTLPTGLPLVCTNKSGKPWPKREDMQHRIGLSKQMQMQYWWWGCLCS